MEGLAEQPSAAAAAPFEPDHLMLRSIIDASPISMVVASATGHVIYMNRAFQNVFGPGAQDRVQPRIHDMVGPDDDVARSQIERLLAGEISTYQGEHRCKDAQGGLTWAALSMSSVVSEATGLPIYLVAQLSDIEHLKRAEEALTQSESRWHFALEAARQGVWDHDSRTRRMYYSPTWRTLRGFSPDEEVDDSREAWLSRLHPEDRERIRPNVPRQNAGEDGYDILEYRERHKDGHYVWILSRGKPVAWDSDGNVIRTVGTDTDITHLKEVEAELAAEKERWRVTLEAIADATISVDPDHRVNFLNLEAQSWTGLTSSEAAGRDVGEILNLKGADCCVLTKLVHDCLATGETQHCDDEVLLLSRDGTQRDVRFSVAAVRPANSAPLGAVIVLHDVTRSRSLQRLLEHNATHDDLTGLKNRAAFNQALAGLAHDSGVHSLLFIDLDNFKPVNDTLGHAAGDEVLKAVARELRDCVRKGDICARLGGDEFALILRNCDRTDGARIGHDILDRIHNLQPWADRQLPKLGASIGLSEIIGGMSPEAALATADAACYLAKSKGRGRLEQLEVGGIVWSWSQVPARKSEL